MFHVCLLIGIQLPREKSSAIQLPSPFLTSLCAMVFPISFFSLGHGNTLSGYFLEEKREESLTKMYFSAKSSFEEHF